MDRSEVKAVVDREIEAMAKALGVAHWSLTVSYGPCSRKEWSAECVRQAEYNVAKIIIDPEKQGDEDDVLDSLLHELAHVVLAPFDTYRSVMTAADVPGSPADKRERNLWAFAVEQGVICVMRAYRGTRARYEPQPPQSAPEPPKPRKKARPR